MMKKALFILLVLLSQNGQACNSFEEDLKLALTSHRFMTINFGWYKTGTIATSGKTWFEDKDRKIIGMNFIFHDVSQMEQERLSKRYHIKNTPTLLLIDGNGFEIYRFSDPGNHLTIREALIEFSVQPQFLADELKVFHDKKSYNTALRAAQKYLDYSLTINHDFKIFPFSTFQYYVTEAENLLNKKDKNFTEKEQKIKLIRLFRWAYDRNLSLLDEQLAAFDEKDIAENNLQLFYFLKYIVAKGNNNDALPEIREKTKALTNFNAFEEKADVILSQKI